MKIECIVPISGGKDSQACAKLAVKHFGPDCVEGLFCDTQFEHPMTYAHIDGISEMYGIKIHTVCAGSVEEQIKKHKRFPGGGARFCTEQLKIWPTRDFCRDFAKSNGGFEVWYGMRLDESHERAKRYAGRVGEDVYAPHEINKKYPKYLAKAGVSFRLPILEWHVADVMDFLGSEVNPLYSFGFGRVGCFPCLAAGDAHKEKAFRFDETGERHLAMARSLEGLTGHSVYTSKRCQLRYDSGQIDCFEGCAICAI